MQLTFWPIAGVHVTGTMTNQAEVGKYRVATPTKFHTAATFTNISSLAFTFPILGGGSTFPALITESRPPVFLQHPSRRRQRPGRTSVPRLLGCASIRKLQLWGSSTPIQSLTPDTSQPHLEVQSGIPRNPLTAPTAYVFCGRGFRCRQVSRAEHRATATLAAGAGAAASVPETTASRSMNTVLGQLPAARLTSRSSSTRG